MFVAFFLSSCWSNFLDTEVPERVGRRIPRDDIPITLRQWVVLCTEDMLTGSLWEAINTKQPNLEASKIAKALPRICFLSGLTGEEMMMFIDAFPESGLAGTVFAAVVPNSADKPLLEVIEEIMGDHEMMKSRQTS
ncbi:uncharacterized conserved protein [Tanacetum coccineum]